MPDREPGLVDPFHEEVYESALSRLLGLAEGRADRWIDLLKDFDHLPFSFKEKLIRRLEGNALDLAQPECASLWDRLRAIIAEHEHFSDAPWRMTDEQIRAMRRIAEKYEPPSPVERVKWAFGKSRYRPLAPSGSEDHFQALRRVQDQAAQDLFAAGGLGLLLTAAGEFEVPLELGLAVGRSVTMPATDEQELVTQVTASKESARSLALGFVGGRFQREGWTWIHRIAEALGGRLEPSPTVVVRVPAPRWQLRIGQYETPGRGGAAPWVGE